MNSFHSVFENDLFLIFFKLHIIRNKQFGREKVKLKMNYSRKFTKYSIVYSIHVESKDRDQEKRMRVFTLRKFGFIVCIMSQTRLMVP